MWWLRVRVRPELRVPCLACQKPRGAPRPRRGAAGTASGAHESGRPGTAGDTARRAVGAGAAAATRAACPE
eukprot:7287858-Alexandrium_andersonii.AAC.1